MFFRHVRILRQISTNHLPNLYNEVMYKVWNIWGHGV